MAVLQNDMALTLQMERLRGSPTLADAWQFFSLLMQDYGFEYSIYGFFTLPVHENCLEEAISYSTLPNAYLELGRKYSHHEDDYLNWHWVSDGKPYRWMDPTHKMRQKFGASKLEKDLKNLDPIQGISIPFRSHQNMVIGGLSVATPMDDFDAFTIMWDEAESHVMALGKVLHDYMTHPKRINQHFGLTRREKECLYWSMAGLSSKQIGYELAIAQKTAEHHLQSGTKKLQARNKTHAVTRAMTLGVLRDQSLMPRDWVELPKAKDTKA